MKKHWQLPSGTTDAVTTHRIEHVLEQHDGPVAISLKAGNDRRFFAVAADGEGDVTRWVEAEVGDAEWRSLLYGRTALRDVFRKVSVYVVDRKPDLSLESAWEVAPSELLDTHLPAQDAFFDEDDFSEILGEGRAHLGTQLEGPRSSKER